MGNNQRKVIQRALAHARPGHTEDMRMLPICYKRWYTTGTCNMCGTPEEDPIVEHHHVNGQERGPIRGLCCRSCNTIEGKMKKKLLEMCSGRPLWETESLLDKYEQSIEQCKLIIFRTYRPFFRRDIIDAAQEAGSDAEDCMEIDSWNNNCEFFNQLHNA
uniref:Recombination endonuclease VII n=1 Tax=viral metagenome TaxID=1070528 RepID=A0A6C0K940_9ZZZZ